MSKLADKRIFPGPTKSAVAADFLKNYLVNNGLATIKAVAWSDNSVGGAQLGDLVGYDWDEPGPDGVIDHLAMVTLNSGSDGIYVTQHTPARINRFWSWDPSARNWIQYTKKVYTPKVYLIHIL